MLNNIGLPGLLLIAIVVLVLFGRGKVSSLMGEVGKGITAFKQGVNDGAAEIERDAAATRANAAAAQTPRQIDEVADDLESIAARAEAEAQRARAAAERARTDAALRDITPPRS